MSKKDDAIAIMPKYLTMIESDLVKVTHYLKDAIKVAVVLEDDSLAGALAGCYVSAENLTNSFKVLTAAHTSPQPKKEEQS